MRFRAKARHRHSPSQWCERLEFGASQLQDSRHSPWIISFKSHKCYEVSSIAIAIWLLECCRLARNVSGREVKQLLVNCLEVSPCQSGCCRRPGGPEAAAPCQHCHGDRPAWGPMIHHGPAGWHLPGSSVALEPCPPCHDWLPASAQSGLPAHRAQNGWSYRLWGRTFL